MAADDLAIERLESLNRVLHNPQTILDRSATYRGGLLWENIGVSSEDEETEE